MRTEFVYSIIALGAIPVVVNAAEQQKIPSNGDALVSVDGAKVTYPIGKLVPGSYTFSAKLTSKVYGVTVKIAGKTVDVPSANNPKDPNVTINFDLDKETDVELELVSSDPGEDGAGFTVADAVVILNFNLAKAKEDWATAIGLLKTKNVPAYDYDDDDEAADLKAADDLIAELNKIEDTYEAYVAQKLYQKASVPQGKIDALAATIAAHQNTQAYNNVNAAITAIKAKYNTAVADLKAALVNEAAYLLDAALKDLDDNINKKITDATQASYASYTGKTAVADEATNKALIPTEEAINSIVNNWKGQGTTTQAAYDALQKKVTDLQAALDAAVPVESVASLFPKTDAQTAINALNSKIEGVANSAAQETVDVSKEEAAAQKAVGDYATKVGKANAEYKANEATVAAIKTLQDNLDAAKAAVNAMKSADGNYEAKNYYDAYVADIQKDINKFSTDAAAAYKADGTGTAQAYNAALNTAPTQAKIDVYGGTTEPAVDGKPKQAVDKYNALQTAINGVDAEHPGYQGQLNAARAQVESYAVYSDDTYDYKTKFDLLQKRINDINKAIKAAQGKVGAEHWTAMLAIDADAAITTDIADLLSSVQADQNKYDADFLANGMTTLEDKITAFKAKDASVLGADVAKFQAVETDIETAYNAVKDAKAKIAADGKSVDLTAKVGTGKGDWKNAQNCPDAEYHTFTGNGVTLMQVFGVTGVGDVLNQEVEVENGIYDIEVYATSHNAWNGQYGENKAGKPTLQEDADDVAYVYGSSANEVKTWITARRNSGLVAEEPVAYTIKGVKVENGKLKIGLSLAKAAQTEWHTIQIVSLKGGESVVSKYIQSLGQEVAKLNAQQEALETAANDVAAKVAANAKAKADLATSIGDNEATPKTGMWKSIDDFKNLYNIGKAESTLGNRGKADGEVTKAVDTLEKDLKALQDANTAVVPTAVNDADKSSDVDNTPNGWALVDMAHTGNANRLTGDKIDGKQLVEQYTSAGAADYGKAGIVMKQKLTGLANGIYDVVLYANAVDQASGNPNKGKTDIAYVYANDAKVIVPVTSEFNAKQEGYKFENIVVSNGTLELGLAKAKGGTNWHSILLKSLNYRENSQDALYNNADEKNPGLNNRYTKLNNTLNALEKAAPDIVAAVKANADTNTAATKAVADLQTAELNTLKSLKNVTNAEAVSDDATAKKADPANFKVFETGLAADKSYTAKKAAIDTDITAMSAAIAASNANETLVEDWKNNSITVVITPDDEKTPDVDETVKKTYSIAALTQTINDLKTEAVAESDNWEAYKALQDNNMSKLLPDTITVDAADMGAGAVAYYQGLKDDYIAAKATILTNMQKALTERKAVSTKNSFVEEIAILIAKVKVVKSDGIANYKKYLEQKKAYQDTQTLWNSTYTEIAATDKSSKVQEWLDELDAIQVTLTAATNAVETNYPKGESVAKAQDFATIQAAINDVKARQSEAYNAQITEDNKVAHESFIGNETTKGYLQLATEAYQRAVAERAKYSSTNEQIKAAVDIAAAKLDEALFKCPDQLADLKAKESAAYVAVVSPTVFDVSSYNTQADDIKKNINSELNTFKNTVQTVINNEVWTPNKTKYTAKVTAAENELKPTYSEAVWKNAFKDVKDLIAKGDAGVASITLSEVEAAIDGLTDIDNMLVADKDKAAKDDITAAKTAANNAYSDAKEVIESKNFDAQVNKDLQAAKLAELENAKKAADAALIDEETEEPIVVTFNNHDDIKPALVNVVDKANSAKTAINAAVTNDTNNTKAYEEMEKAIEPVEAKLAESETAAAPYKYETSFANQETTLELIKSDAEKYMNAGSAVSKKAEILGRVANLNGNKDVDGSIEQNLYNAFYNEKNSLAADITELKNQYNAYVAKNGLDEKAAAFKTAIDNLENARKNAEVKDLDITKEKPAGDGIQYDEILAATAEMVALQKSIADTENDLLKANESPANADALDDLNTQIGELEQTASLEGYDKWVADQTYGNTTLGEAIEGLKTQIAAVKAAVNADEHISFYKDQYQAQIDDIKTDLVPVSAAIKAYDKQFKDNAAAYTRLTDEIKALQAQIDAAKKKVGAYEYVGPDKVFDHTDLIEDYDEDGELEGGAQYDLNFVKNYVDEQNKDENKTVHLIPEAFVSQYRTDISNSIKLYLDESAHDELDEQRFNLYILLDDAMDVGQDEVGYKRKYSSVLWNRLATIQGAITEEIDALEYPIWNSYQLWETNPDYSYVCDENQQWIPKERTSDADYADQKAIIDGIKKEIANLGDAVDNLQLLGDANEDSRVNVLDYQKVINMILDPSLQPDPESEEMTAGGQTQADLFANIDINKSTVIEVGDLTAIVNYILNQNWPAEYAAARSFNRGDNENLSLNYSSVNSDVQRIAVNLENANDYTAFQMDVVLPDGMKIVGTSLSSRAGQSHKLYSRTQQDGSVRILASSISGETFSGNEGAVLYIDVEGAKASSVEILNILFSDVNANTRAFKLGSNVTGIDAIGSTFDALKQKVYDLGGRVMNGVKKGINIIRNADGSTRKVAE